MKARIVLEVDLMPQRDTVAVGDVFHFARYLMFERTGRVQHPLTVSGWTDEAHIKVKRVQVLDDNGRLIRVETSNHGRY